MRITHVIVIAIVVAIISQWGLAVVAQLQTPAPMALGSFVETRNKSAMIERTSFQPRLLREDSLLCTTRWVKSDFPVVDCGNDPNLYGPNAHEYLEELARVRANFESIQKARFGFPWRVLEYERRETRIILTNALITSTSPSVQAGGVILPFRIRWLPMLGNVAAFVLFVLALRWTVIAVRHVSRRLGLRCPNCGYEGGVNECPECGRGLVPSRAAV